VAAPGGKKNDPTARRHAKDRVIVGFKPGASRVRRSSAVSSVDSAPTKRTKKLSKNTVVVDLAAGQTVDEAIDEISELPGVAYVEPDYWVRAVDTSDDPYYLDNKHWGMYGDGTTPANQYGSGAGEAWARGQIGKKSVYVGVIDEGIKVDHPDLSANVWTNPFETVNGIDDDDNGFIDDINGWDFYNDDNSVYDGTGDDHGTHVAGTIGARGGNGVGVAGVNWRVTMISMKFLGAGGGYSSDAVKALNYLVDLKQRHGLNIVASSNSWGGGGYSNSLHDAIKKAGDAGILFIAAAGNNGRDTDESGKEFYPSSYTCDERFDGAARGWDCLISVANLRSDGQRSGSSNWGSTSVDLGAPGSGIWSTHPGSTGYASYSGTSMATPHVAGAAALCASLDSSLSPKQIRNLIISTAKPTGSMNGITTSGDRLDVGKLSNQCAPDDPDPTPTPTPEPTPTVPPVGETLTVDDRSPWFIRNGGGWKQGDSGYKDHHYWVPTRKQNKKRSGAWKPTLAKAGWYEIILKIPASHGTSRKAPYKVKTSSGWVKRIRNQKARRGDWVSLGVHKLGTRPIVKLADKTGEAGSLGRRLAFDAARFVPTTKPAVASAGASGDGDSNDMKDSNSVTITPEPAPTAAATETPQPNPAPSPQPEAEPQAPTSS
jgi:subtilisin family serine protease